MCAYKLSVLEPHRRFFGRSSLPEPQDAQRENHAGVLKVGCPVCCAEAGEPCAPMSNALPHLLRFKVSAGAPLPAADSAPGRAGGNLPGRGPSSKRASFR